MSDQAATPTATRERMTLAGGKAYGTVVWHDLADAVDDVLNSGDHCADMGAASTRKAPAGDRFYGSTDMPAAMAMLADGWADKRDAVERIISDLDCDPMIADRIALRDAPPQGQGVCRSQPGRRARDGFQDSAG